MKKKRQQTKTGCVGHVTLADGNIFLDLGFPPEEAVRLLADAGRMIDERKAIKSNLLNALASWINEVQPSPQAAANKLGESPERISMVMVKDGSKFTIDQLATLLIRAGKKIQVDIT